MKNFTASLIVAVTLLCASGFLPAHAEDEDCPMKTFMKENVEHCIGKLSDENKKLIEKGEAVDNQETRCFAACILNRTELMKDGKLNMDKIEETIKKYVEESKQENWRAAINKCRGEAEQQDDECDVAGTLANCLKQVKDAMSEK